MTGGPAEREFHFEQDQHDRLKRCSAAKDVTDWNAWRKANPDTEILLEKAECHGASLRGAHLEGANLNTANLDGAHLEGAHLQGARFRGAHMKGAYLEGAHLEGADLQGADLRGAKLSDAHLEGANFTTARVDELTLLWNVTVDVRTNFAGVGLQRARVQPGLATTLEANIRRREWSDWYPRHKLWALVARPFWWVSDYGTSTGRIILVFFMLAGLFASFYAWCPELLDNLEAAHELPPNMSSWTLFWVSFLRPLYFSVVTMTTLGFGDIYASARSPLGHILLMLQVLLGYALLGALVTRLAILFQSLGPARGVTETEKG